MSLLQIVQIYRYDQWSLTILNRRISILLSGLCSLPLKGIKKCNCRRKKKIFFKCYVNMIAAAHQLKGEFHNNDMTLNLITMRTV